MRLSLEPMFRASLLLLTTLSSPPLGRAQTADDATPTSPQAILRAAFANRYEVDTIANLDLIMRNRSGQERRRSFYTVSKLIDGRLHSIGRLTAPEYLRGMTVMVIEVDRRHHDSFVFLPSLGRVRRVTTAQRVCSR